MADSNTVTIKKAYFETLLRKADVHGNESPPFQQDPSSITVSRHEYDMLASAYREYSALQNALLCGGVTQENLQILINSGLEVEAPIEHDSYLPDQQSTSPSEHNNFLPKTLNKPSTIRVKAPPPVSPTYQENSPHANGDTGIRYARINGQSRPSSDITTTPDIYEGKENYDPRRSSSGNRTLFFSRLSPKTSYAGLLEVIRGGAVVDVWMKPADHCASVSFVELGAAEVFYRYAKKNDIYIDGRRINVEWREPARQFIIVPNILRQIDCNGASRNLSLRNIPPTLTEERLRDDLDHIANLHVERVTFDRRSKSVQVNLNSIAVACFAKTCLRSRAYYKGCKVDFGVDECAQKLPEKLYRKQQPSKPATERAVGNRFNALTLDEDVEEDEDTVGRNPSEKTASWADSGWTGGTANGVSLDDDDI